MGLPAIVTVLTNATTSTTTSSSGYASSSKRMPMIDVSPNATQIFAQLISVLYGSATSSTTDESSSLALRLVTAGSCASANATDVLTAPTTFSSGAPSESVWRAECAVWRLRLGSGDSHFATTTSMSGTTTTSSALGTLAAVVTNMTRFAEARAYFLSTGVEYTQYHYLYRRWRSAATWGVNVSAANISHNPIQANSMLMLPSAHRASPASCPGRTRRPPPPRHLL
ncbi:Hypothetical protein, putative [Bodo saltans]|uniref:Uncharacterized protein n=1 Tax=Bodo saltans TaxID=75058 RepID=A0A0S4J3M2_BODSA|nr:Hypothetical protein, putative [Bodo saltans]|eukprot:CUG33868.1 Hypothetical protein, putative [Bodo saltans]